MIYWGLLGWSNKRPGLEFYRYDEKTIPRHGPEWGDLLATEDDSFRDHEGCPVIVIVLDRKASKDDLIKTTHSIQAVLSAGKETSE